ncbi:hypothetical protein Sa4125_45140 [Aureimonas sp. SA4125]|uniref:small ribosomal subunit Rsm22 family protein n=1 Tax=Aureimonas sp. SA4125 TaxID=2826993 RepID=UPI001CC5F9F1|nr:small ribosomal subunit Rsm22 family protein [Aureimonas sp. SA4125]BDA86972.1 hypothetical protein Sa4125_45140 [Aureimonas sp. SA4125]
MAELPAALGAAIDALMEGRQRGDLHARAGRISHAYRAGATSTGVVREAGDALAYAVSRLPATYAAVRHVLDRLVERCPDFAPASGLDVGAGPGTASWAMAEAFPTLSALTQVDCNRAFLDLARTLAADAVSTALRQPVQRLADLVGKAPLPQSDLVVLGYALAELAQPSQGEVVERLWAATAGALVIVEPGTPAGYQRILAARDVLIGLQAKILAPCPHQAPCPLVAPDWCHFAVRLSRSRDHMAAKAATLGYEDEKFSYLVAVRPALFKEANAGRILDRPETSKIAVAAKLCGTDGTVAVALVPRRQKPAYAAARRLRWGDELRLGRNAAEADASPEPDASPDCLD